MEKYDKIWVTLNSVCAEYFLLLMSFVKIAILKWGKSYIQLMLRKGDIPLKDSAATVKARSELLIANHKTVGEEELNLRTLSCLLQFMK